MLIIDYLQFFVLMLFILQYMASHKKERTVFIDIYVNSYMHDIYDISKGKYQFFLFFCIFIFVCALLNLVNVKRDFPEKGSQEIGINDRFSLKNKLRFTE